MKKSTIIILVVVALVIIYSIGKTNAKMRGYTTTSFGATIFGVPKNLGNQGFAGNGSPVAVN